MNTKHRRYAFVESLEQRTLFAVTVPPFETSASTYVDVAKTDLATVMVKSLVNGERDAQVFVEIFNASGERVNRFGVDFFIGDEIQPVVSAAGSRFVVAWVRRDANGKYKALARVYDMLGDPQSNMLKIHTSRTLSPDPAVAINSSGDVVVTYTRENDGDRDIHGKIYNRRGELRANINVATGRQPEYSSSVAITPIRSLFSSDDDYRFDVAYERTDRSGDPDVYVQPFKWVDKVLKKNGRIAIATGGDSEVSPQIAFSPDGTERIVSWTSGSHFARRYSGGDGPAGEEAFQINVAEPFARPLDIAIANTGVALAHFEGFIIEDPENVTGQREAIPMPGDLAAAIAVAPNGSYAGASTVDGDEGEDDWDDAWAMLGTLPTV